MDISYFSGPGSHKYKYILGLICEFSNYCRFFPLTAKTAKKTARASRKFFEYQGAAVRKVKTDNGREFMGEFADLCDSLNIEIIHATPYWKNKNCQIERAFRSIKEHVSALLEEGKTKSWVACLDKATEISNSTPQAKLNMSPFQAAFGYSSRKDYTEDKEAMKNVNETIAKSGRMRNRAMCHLKRRSQSVRKFW